MIRLAAGLQLGGALFATVYQSNALVDCMDEARHDLCKHALPVGPWGLKVRTGW